MENRQLEMTEFFVVDSRLSSASLLESPYQPTSFCHPAEYVPPSGIYLVVYGRTADGYAVVAETRLTEGLGVCNFFHDLCHTRCMGSAVHLLQWKVHGVGVHHVRPCP